MDPERVVNGLCQDLLDDSECPICFCITYLADAKECLQCKKIFCHACIFSNSKTKCPMCQYSGVAGSFLPKVVYGPIDNQLTSDIKQIEFTCCQDVCTHKNEKMKYDDHRKHLDYECTINNLECVNGSCGGNDHLQLRPRMNRA
jgi:hypothetical protein